MSASASPTSLAAVAYVQAGLSLVSFERGEKRPTRKGWNKPESCINTIERAAECKGNIGLAHAYSRTCCIDIDDMVLAFEWFSGVGIDLAEYWNSFEAVRMTSGMPNRGKLLYRLPADAELLPTRMFKGYGVELRCATAERLTVQDVLPPSIHPVTGQPYKWLGPGTFQNIPIIPADLLAFWRNLVAPKEAPAGSAAPVGMDETAIQAVLDRINPKVKEYKDWLAVGMALHHELGGAPVGLDIWDTWSISDGNNPKYRGRAELESSWSSFRLDRENPITLRSLERLTTKPVDMSGEWEAIPDEACAPGSEKSEAAKPKFKIETPAEFAAVDYEDDYIDGVLPDAPYGVIMGQSGKGKTFVAMDLAFAMARGVRWRDRATKPARVLYIAAEGATGVRKRLKAYAQHHRIALDSINVEFLGAAPDLTKSTDVRALIDSIKARGIAYTHIVIDTWSQVTPGADENSSHDMGAALKNVQILHHDTGARILFVAHMGKDVTKGMRGWSGFKAAMDYEIEVSREGEQRTLTVSKSRDSMDGARFAFRLQPVSLGLTKRGKPVISCVVVHGGAPRQRPVSKVQAAVLATVEMYFEANNGAWMPGSETLQIAKNRLLLKKGERDQRRKKVRIAICSLIKKSWLEEKDGNYRPFSNSADL